MNIENHSVEVAELSGNHHLLSILIQEALNLLTKVMEFLHLISQVEESLLRQIFFNT
jgi:hypothetical protein